MRGTQTTTGDAPGRDLRRAAAAVAAVMFAATIFVAVADVEATAGGQDQNTFHLPTIEDLAADFPGVDLRDLETATTPLVHLSLATVDAVTGLGADGLQILSSLYALAFVVLLGAICGGIRPRPAAYAAFVFIAASPYVWQSGLWINTDAAAALFAATVLFVVFRGPVTGRRAAACAVLATLAVCTRQTYVWLLVPLVLACLSPARPEPWPERLRNAAFVTVLPSAALALFVSVWGGLTPPVFQEVNAYRATPISPAYGAAVVAVFAVAFALYHRMHRIGARLLLPAATAGVALAALAIVFESDYSGGEPAERTGGWLWDVVAKAPALQNRSLVIVVMAAAGGTALAAMLLHLADRGRRRDALLLGAGFVATWIVLGAGAQAFQRYYEVPGLLLLAFLAWRLGAAPPDAAGPPTRGLGTLALVGAGAFQLFTLAAVVAAPVLREAM